MILFFCTIFQIVVLNCLEINIIYAPENDDIINTQDAIDCLEQINRVFDNAKTTIASVKKAIKDVRKNQITDYHAMEYYNFLVSHTTKGSVKSPGQFCSDRTNSPTFVSIRQQLMYSCLELLAEFGITAEDAIEHVFTLNEPLDSYIGKPNFFAYCNHIADACGEDGIIPPPTIYCALQYGQGEVKYNGQIYRTARMNFSND